MLASFSIFPVGLGEKLSTYVAGIIKLIDESGLDYRMGSMETTVEGDFDEIIELIRKCHMEMRAAAPRVITSINIDDREGYTDRLTGKIEDVEKILGREVKK